MTDPVSLVAGINKFLWRKPHQYLKESAADSGKWLKHRIPLFYYYASLRPINRLLRHLKTDVFLISYPKCGRTWLRLMIGKYLSDHHGLTPENLLDVKRMSRGCASIPDVLISHDDAPHYRRFNELEGRKEMYRGKTVLFLVRDPRDVIVSRYHHVYHREGRKDVAGTLSQFLRSEPGSFRTVIRYYNVWRANADIPKRFQLIRYEDMQDDTARELRRALPLFGVEEVDDRLVREAVEHARFDRMRKMEQEEQVDSGALQKGEGDSENAYKTRKGRVGSFREEVSGSDVAFMNEIMNKRLAPEFGYTPVGD